MATDNHVANLARDLIRIHKVITRGLTSGLEHSRNFQRLGFPDAKTCGGFTDYLQALASVLEAHHLGEDEVAFPYFKDRLPDAPYERLAADHQKIDGLIRPFREAVAKMDENGGQSSSLAMVIDGLQNIHDLWAPHIQVEEQQFSETALAPVMSPEEQGQLSAALAKHSADHAAPGYLVLPFVLYNQEPEDRAAMASTMPDIVTGELIPKAWKDRWTPMTPFLLM